MIIPETNYSAKTKIKGGSFEPPVTRKGKKKM
jgi:hypothetical protein